VRIAVAVKAHEHEAVGAPRLVTVNVQLRWIEDLTWMVTNLPVDPTEMRSKPAAGPRSCTPRRLARSAQLDGDELGAFAARPDEPVVGRSTRPGNLDLGQWRAVDVITPNGIAQSTKLDYPQARRHQGRHHPIAHNTACHCAAPARDIGSAGHPAARNWPNPSTEGAVDGAQIDAPNNVAGS
jgi:hypothetical protein